MKPTYGFVRKILRSDFVGNLKTSGQRVGMVISEIEFCVGCSSSPDNSELADADCGLFCRFINILLSSDQRDELRSEGFAIPITLADQHYRSFVRSFAE